LNIIPQQKNEYNKEIHFSPQILRDFSFYPQGLLFFSVDDPGGPVDYFFLHSSRRIGKQFLFITRISYK